MINANYSSLLSELFHLVRFRFKRPQIQLKTGMLIISIDVDVGNRELGVINKGKNDKYVHRFLSEYQVGKIEETALPLFLNLFEDQNVPATFAVRGQMIEVANSFFHQLLESPIRHDIGSHGYSHRLFEDMSPEEAENELEKLSDGFKRFGIIPKSFIFPRNSVDHLDLIEDYGYKCYRSDGDFRNDCMYIEKQGNLYDVHPSLYIGNCTQSIFLKKLLDIAILRKMPFHIWFHLWNFGITKDSIQQRINSAILPFLEYATNKTHEQILTIETMFSAILKYKS